MSQSTENAVSSISFKEFCRIIDTRGGRDSTRANMRNIYKNIEYTRGRVTRMDASLLADTIVAQGMYCEW